MVANTSSSRSLRLWPAATHHSAQQKGAPRRPKTATRARDGKVYETHEAPRRRGTPRPGLLAEPGPQRSDRSLRHSSKDTSSQPSGLPVLAGASGELVDSSALRFLTASALEAKRKLEQGAHPRGRSEAEAPIADRFASVAPHGSLPRDCCGPSSRKRRITGQLVQPSPGLRVPLQHRASARSTAVL